MASSQATPTSYLVKRVRFFSGEVPVFLQNVNGPCPLLAIANVLSLRNELRLPSPHAREVAQDQLISLVAERLLEASAAFEGSAPELASDMRQNVSDSFEALSKLATGVDVNVRFTAIGAFEPTNEVAVFDLLGISLVHGWLVDPADTTQAAVFGSKSYNELVEMLFLTLGDEEAGRVSSMKSLPNLARTGSAPRHSYPGSFNSTGTGAASAAAAAIAAAAAPEALDASAAAARGPHLVSEAADAAPSAAEVDAATSGEHFPTPASHKAAPAPAASATPQQQAQGSLPSAVAEPLTGTTAQAEQAAARCQPDAAQPSVDPATVPSASIEAQHVIEGLISDMVAGLSLEAAPAPIPLGETPSPSPTPETSVPSAGPTAGTAGASESAASASSSAAVTAGMVTPARSSASGSDLAHAHVVRDFLERHCSQLTDYGLSALLSGLRENQLAVFFRNNHFNTLFKHGDAVFLLVTDQGYASEPDIVWERLDSVNTSTFATSDFQAFVPHRPSSYAGAVAGDAGRDAAADIGAAAHGDGSADADYALALQLQLQEEEEQQARERRALQRQQQEEQAAAAAGRAGAPSPQGQRTQGAAPQHVPLGSSPTQQRWGQQQQQQQQTPQQQQQQTQQQQAPQPLGRLGQGVKQQMEEAKDKCTIM